MDFLFSRNRLNVAVSRAQALSVVVCSPSLLLGALQLGRADATRERALPIRRRRWQQRSLQRRAKPRRAPQLCTRSRRSIRFAVARARNVTSMIRREQLESLGLFSGSDSSDRRNPR